MYRRRVCVCCGVSYRRPSTRQLIQWKRSHAQHRPSAHMHAMNRAIISVLSLATIEILYSIYWLPHECTYVCISAGRPRSSQYTHIHARWCALRVHIDGVGAHSYLIQYILGDIVSPCRLLSRWTRDMLSTFP